MLFSCQAQRQAIAHAQAVGPGHSVADDGPDDVRFAAGLRRPATGDILDAILDAFVGAQVQPLAGRQFAAFPGEHPRRFRRPGHAVQVSIQFRLQQAPDTGVERLKAGLIDLGGRGQAQVAAGHARTLEREAEAHLDDGVHQQRAAGQQGRGQDHTQAQGEQDLPMLSEAPQHKTQKSHDLVTVPGAGLHRQRRGERIV